jgi:hypothetical protein
MAIEEVIRRLVVEAETRGMDRAAQQFRSTADAFDAIAQSGAVVGRVTTETEGKVTSVAAAFGRVAGRLEPFRREMENTARDFEVLRRALGQGLTDPTGFQELSRARIQQTAAYKQEVERVTAALKEQDDAFQRQQDQIARIDAVVAAYARESKQIRMTAEELERLKALEKAGVTDPTSPAAQRIITEVDQTLASRAAVKAEAEERVRAIREVEVVEKRLQQTMAAEARRAEEYNDVLRERSRISQEINAAQLRAGIARSTGTERAIGGPEAATARGAGFEALERRELQAAAEERLQATREVEAVERRLQQTLAAEQRRAEEYNDVLRERLRISRDLSAAQLRQGIERATGTARAEGGPASAVREGAGFEALQRREMRAMERERADEAKRVVEALKGQQTEYQRLASVTNQYRAALDPIAHEHDHLVRSLADIKAAVRGGIMPADLGEAAIANANKRIDVLKRNLGKDGVAEAARLASYQLVNLGQQVNDVFSGLAMGQSPFTILTQQGGQFYQILAGTTGGIRGGLEAVSGMFGRFLTLGRVAFGGVAASAAGLAVAMDQQAAAARTFQTALGGIGRGSGATVNQLMEISNASARASEVSISAAQSIATEFVRTGRIGVEHIGGLTALVKDYAATTGTEIPEAQKAMAQAFADPARGIDMLAEAIGGVDANTQRLIRSWAASGQSGKAQAAMLEIVRQNTIKARDSMSFLAREWDEFTTLMSTGFSRLGQRANEAFVPNLAKDIERLQRYREEVSGIASMTSWGQGNLEAIDRQIAALQKLARAQGEAAAAGRDRAEAERTSKAGAEVIDQLNAEFAALQRLIDQREMLLKLSADPAAMARLPPGYGEAVGRNIAGLDTAIAGRGGDPTQAQAAANQRLVDSYNLQLEAMNALNPAQQALIAMRQKELELSTQVIEPVSRLMQIYQAGTQIIDQATASAARQAYELNVAATAQSAYSAAVRAGIISQSEADDRMQATVRTSEMLRAAEDLRAEATKRAAAGDMDAANALAQRAAVAERAANELSRAILAEGAARRQRSVTDYLRAQQQEIINTQLEIDLIGKSTEERNRLIAARRAEIEIQRLGVEGNKAEEESIRAINQGLADRQTQLERQRDMSRLDTQGQHTARATGWTADEVMASRERVQADQAQARAIQQFGFAADRFGRYVNRFGEEVDEYGRTNREAQDANSFRVTPGTFGPSSGPSAPMTFETQGSRVMRGIQEMVQWRQQREAAINGTPQTLDRELSLVNSTIGRQISSLRERLSDVDQTIERTQSGMTLDRPDPYLDRNPEQFYRGGTAFAKENDPMSALLDEARGERAAIERQIEELERQSREAERFSELMSAGVTLQREEIDAVRVLTDVMESFGTEQEKSDFERMLEASRRPPATNDNTPLSPTTPTFGGPFNPIFAGRFASGGDIPTGKWGLTGEAGPELVTRPTRVDGPAKVTPIKTGTTIHFNQTIVAAGGVKQLKESRGELAQRAQAEMSRLAMKG